MGRRRKTNTHLPERVYWKNGAFRYLSKDNKWIKLGTTLHHMYDSLAKIYSPSEIKTVKELIERYMIEVSTQKAQSTHQSELKRAEFLIAYFGDMYPKDVTTVDVYRYMDLRGTKGKTAANRECALFSHIFSYAIRWGKATQNPCSYIKKFSEKKRCRNLSMEEFKNVLKMASYPINFAMRLAYIMGLRPTEVLCLKKSNMSQDGFLVEVTKTQKSLSKKIIKWSPSLRQVVADVKHHQSNRIQHIDYLLCNRSGKPYTPAGFRSLWQKTIQDALNQKLIKESFQFRDIRHLAALQKERLLGREHAREFLVHTSQNTTARYIDSVEPIDGLEL